jgi:hypothetical protein
MKNWKMLAVVLMFLALFFGVAPLAFADNGSNTVGPSTLTVFDDVVHMVAYTLGTLLIGLVTLAVRKLNERWHLSIPAAWLANLQTYVDHGIAYADEQAHKTGNKLPGNEKLEIALSFVLRMIGDDKRVMALGEAKIRDLIEARLNVTAYNRVVTEPKIIPVTEHLATTIADAGTTVITEGAK